MEEADKDDAAVVAGLCESMSADPEARVRARDWTASTDWRQNRARSDSPEFRKRNDDQSQVEGQRPLKLRKTI